MSNMYKKVISVFKKKYGQILLILLLIVISCLSIRWGKYILSNDNYSPELNPSLSVERYLFSPAWRSYRVLGTPSDSEQADVFRSAIFAVFEPLLPKWLLGQLFYLMSLVVGGVSTAFLTMLLLRKSRLKKYSQIGFLASGILYSTTLWTMWLFYQNMAPYVANFGFFPLLMLSAYMYIEDPTIKKASFFLISCVLFSCVCVISTLFIVDFVAFACFVFFIIFLEKTKIKEKLKKCVKVLSILILSQLFWILPFIHFTVSSSQNVVDSYVNKTITGSTIDLETEMENWVNSARLYNRMLYETDENVPLFSMSAEFQNYDFYKIIGLLPAFFSVLAVIFAIFKKNKSLYIFAIAGFSAWFVMKVVNPPLGGVFVWMQENIPLFKQVLRWPFSKVGEVYVWSIAILGTFGIVYFVSFLSSFIKKKRIKRIFKIALFSIILVLPLAYSEYIFRGELFSKKAVVDLPNEYYSLKDYLEKNSIDERIYYAPPSNNNYFRRYKWGFSGSQFISYIIPNPIMDMSSAVGTGTGETTMMELSNAFRAYDRDRFYNLLQKYDVGYILLDESVDYTGYAFDVDQKGIDQVLSGYEMVWSSDFLKLYKVNGKDTLLEETFSSDIENSLNTFIRNTKYIPSLNLSDIPLKDVFLKNNSLFGNFLYDGNTFYVKPTVSYGDIIHYPAHFIFENGLIKETPSFPHLYNDGSILPYKTFAKSNYDYYVIGSNVFADDDLSLGVTVENEYSSIENIYGVKEKTFISQNMLTDISRSAGSDCSGNGVVSNTSVENMLMASGLELKGLSKLPCAYAKIHSLNVGYSYIVKIKLNWETHEGNYGGYCLFSETSGKCLNKEKFLTDEKSFGENEFLIDTVVRGSDKLSLILYATNINSDNSSSDVIFRKVEFEYAPITDILAVKNSSDDIEVSDYLLAHGNKYTVEIPVIYGSSSYVYNGTEKKNSLWDMNISGNSSDYAKVSWDNGIKQAVENGNIVQSVTALNMEKNKKYLLFREGENISNIPASLCLIYTSDEKCWYQDIFDIDISSSSMTFLESASFDGEAGIIYSSSSNKLKTENILKSVVVMKYPESWNSIRYASGNDKKYKEKEAKCLYSDMTSMYKTEIDDTDEIVSIPQSSASGWVAIGRKDGTYKLVDSGNKVAINGWKQGWDISEAGYTSIYVFYWPNIIGYFGYVILFTLSCATSVKLFKSRKHGNQ